MRNFRRILLMLSFCLVLVSCLNWIMEMPSFALRGIIVRPLSFTEMNLFFDLEIRNPNSFDLTFRSIECTFYLKNEEIGHGRLEKEFSIPSSSTTRAQVPVVVRLRNWSGSLKAILTQEDLPYKIEGKADVRTVLGSRNFPFSNEGSINLKN